MQGNYLSEVTAFVCRVGSFVVWLPRIANQFVRIVETGEGLDLNLCGILQEAINAPPDVSAYLSRFSDRQ